jgi:hypothetical protein
MKAFSGLIITQVWMPNNYLGDYSDHLMWYQRKHIQ